MYTVREANAQDMLPVIDAYYSYYDEVKRNPELGLTLYNEKPDLNVEKKWYADLISSGRAVAVVGEADGRAVGLCTIEPRKENSVMSHIGVLGIAIMQKYRNMGMGRAMITTALELAREKFEIVVLSVYSNNLHAIHLYRSLGFTEYGLLPRAYKRGNKYFDEVLMYKALKA
ncbi:MAG: GNAT family N-acetyltransferase [Nitrososphaerota archaeon]|nr:GNAT family N-acetyltransferase [Nitrososphaerota archaeon]MDG6930172.1 GNAT family N-acetyltransferase [Nitrososphaerota archaeon]MDG6932045.1 GNAT family N-acetyltransferase [Nitrososphaerota archaeon]MDG6935420.1 GNAT family N-acetyltransferase [Nitrososphaerota archaeon]MDG6944584.1 GNAT family N-acetyltransferase [Nitrososphaerota archaeon]